MLKFTSKQLYSFKFFDNRPFVWEVHDGADSLEFDIGIEFSKGRFVNTLTPTPTPV